MSPSYYLKSSSNRYVAKNFLIWLGITTFALLFVICFFEIIETLRRSISRPEATLGVVLELSCLLLPQRFLELLPFIVFLASLLSLWRMNQQQEITALRAMGTSGGQVSIGLALTAFLVGITSVTILNPIAAVLNTRHATLEEKILKRNHNRLSISDTGFWLKENEGLQKVIFHADSFSLKNRTFKQVTFYEYDQKNQFQNRIDADEAKLMDGKWSLKNVRVWSNGKTTQQYIEHNRPTNLTFEKIQQSSIQPTQMPFWRIPSFIRQQSKNGMATIVYEVYWHRLWADIALLSVMAILAVGFCLHNPRSFGTSRMIISALITGFLIHFFNNIVHAYGIGDRLSPFWAAWIPPLVTGFLGIGYLMHAEESA